MAQDESTPKIHIDSDWKAEAQQEKERLAAKEKTADPKAAGGRQPLPEASFQTLMSVLASQAIMGLGAYGDPKTGRVVVDLEGAQFSIDLLAVLEEKTKGNLTEEEASELRQLLAELRSRYVQISDLVTRQQAAGGAAIEKGVSGAAPPNLKL